MDFDDNVRELFAAEDIQWPIDIEMDEEYEPPELVIMQYGINDPETYASFCTALAPVEDLKRVRWSLNANLVIISMCWFGIGLLFGLLLGLK